MEQHQIVEKWHEVPVSVLSGRTQMGRIAKTAQENGWDIRLAKTVVKTTKRNGKEVTEDFYWLGGAKPEFDEPEKVFLFNKFYSSFNNQDCDFKKLQELLAV